VVETENIVIEVVEVIEVVDIVEENQDKERYIYYDQV
jgi:hypothetical protein